MKIGKDWMDAGAAQLSGVWRRVEARIFMGFPFPDSGSAWWELLGGLYRVWKGMQGKCLYFVRV